jgi:Type II secretion system (T2SS), protein G
MRGANPTDDFVSIRRMLMGAHERIVEHGFGYAVVFLTFFGAALCKSANDVNTCFSPYHQTRRVLRGLEGVYETWLINNPGQHFKCPTLQDFESVLSRDQPPNDPWGHPYRIRCHPERFTIEFVSCGPDGEEDTADDIRIATEWRGDAGP